MLLDLRDAGLVQVANDLVHRRHRLLLHAAHAALQRAFRRRPFLVLLPVQRPHHAVDHIRRLALRERDAVLVDLALGVLLAEAGDHRAQFRRLDRQRMRQVVHRRADRHRAYQLVRLAAGHVIGFRQQQLDAAARHQARHGRLGLGAPLLQRGGAHLGVVGLVGRHLPAEQRTAGRRQHRHQQVAGVGQERRRFRDLGLALQRHALQRGLRQLVHLGVGFDVGARQLVDRIQRGRHRHQRLVGQQVGVEVGRQRGQHVRRDRAGGDREAGPGQDRRGHQQHVIDLGHAVGFDRDLARFADRFHTVHQHVVGVQVFLEQAVERGVDGVLVAGFQEFLELRIEGMFPGPLFDTAGRLPDSLGIGGEALALGRQFLG